MINVDADGNITINGSSNFKVYKNGRPNNSMSKIAKDIFQALPASMIKRVEVITEPGAKFDAEGVAAVLNIVTVENTVIKGVMGNASVSGTTVQPFQNANVYLTSQIDKLTFSLNGGTQYMSDETSRQISTQDLEYENGIKSHNTMNQANKGWVGWGGLELSFELDTLNLFTAESNLFFYNVKPEMSEHSEMFAADGSLLSSYNSNVNYPKYGYFDFDATFSYQHSTKRKGETLGLSYMISTTNNDSQGQHDYYDVVGSMVPYSAMEMNRKLHFIEHTFQGDWTRPFGKIHSLELGGKYIIRRNNSEDTQNYVGWENRYTKFRHITDIGALYGQYSVRLNRFSLRAGLRYEFSKLRASYPAPSIPVAEDKPFSTTLHDWVPSAAVSYKINDANSLTFNYATRINRPGISYLNPAELVTPTQIGKGNPDLESARHQSFKMSYMLIRPKFNMQASAQYGFSNNSIEQYTSLGDDNILYTNYANIGRTRQWSFQAYAQWTAGSKTRLMFNLFASHNKEEYAGAMLSHWSWGGYANINQKLPWKLEAELSAYLMPEWNMGAYSRINTSFGQRLMPALSLKRNFLKEDRLSVRVSWVGMFKPERKFDLNYTSGPYTGWNRMVSSNNQFVQFAVSYRFGSLNAMVKKTKARISNNDLQGGSGNNSGGDMGGQGK